jgi:threonine dehydrogenase-like Zn-dependent dehydrogenase
MLNGCQAEFVRVPCAEGTLVALPADLHPEEGLLVGDIWSTAVFCAANAGMLDAGAGAGASTPAVAALSAAAAAGVLPPVLSSAAGNAGHRTVDRQDSGRPYVVVGCGPVGLLTVVAALVMLRLRAQAAVSAAAVPGGQPAPAPLVFAVDSVPERLAAAARLGAIPLDFTAQDVPAAVRVAAGVRGGAEAVMEAVGGSTGAPLRLAYDCLRPGGTLSSVGVHTAPGFPFPPAAAYDRNITFRSGRCPARSIIPFAIALPAAQARAQKSAAACQ